ncbi:MAG TPA: hypothetical protein VJ890_01685, partial [Vineibacter sp.]|nr:hypothetical protein [Vineibacter sp.]
MSLLFYKYVPSMFNDEFMLRQTELQMTQDQRYYKLAADTRGQTRAPQGYVFVFSEAQVKDRVVSFAKNELLPTYKKYWADAASRIPTAVSFSLDFSLEHLEYADGGVRRRTQKELVAFYETLSTGTSYKVGRDVMLQMPPLGEREIVMPPPTLFGVVPATHYAETVNAGIGGNTYIAFDRKIIVPALTMDGRTAERMWRRPDCSTSEFTYQQQGMPQPQARAAVQQCSAERQQYTGSIRTTVDLEIEGVDRL